MSGQNTYPGTAGYQGQQGFLTGGSPYNAMEFMARQIIAGKAFAAMVTVKSVTNSGGAIAAGTVSVQPMVDQIDGSGNRVPHGTIYNIPYFRLQGGGNSVIIDPQVGDHGLAVICDRDISSVKATKGQAAPGSRRQNSWADGLYLGGFLNAVSTTTIRFSASGIEITAPGGLTIHANVDITGTVTNNGVNISSTHRHDGVQTGIGNTGVPH